MRQPFVATLVIVSFLATNCGRIQVQGDTMSEAEAMTHLSELPMSQGGYNLHGRRSQISANELMNLIQDNAQSVQGRNATSTSSGVGGLADMLNLIQSGATTVPTLANAMVASNGTPSKASKVLSAILAVVTALQPILLIIAPQFAPILAAILTIVPIVQNFIQSIMSQLNPAPSPAPAS